MKPQKVIIISLLAVLILTGCASQERITFAGKDWFVSNHYAEIMDTDSLFAFTFNNELVDSETPLIGKEDSPFLTKNVDDYLRDVLKLSEIKNAEILFYAPKYNVLFAALEDEQKLIKPLSVSYEMNDSLPSTFWVRPWEKEKSKRQADEMYTNIYQDKGKKLITVVDRFNYGEIPIARIHIIQSATKKLKKKFPNYEIGMVWMDINKTESLDALSYWINGHRETSFENYKLGVIKNQKIQTLNR